MLEQKHITIVSGGTLGPWALDYIRKGAFLLGVDRGALFLIMQGIVPDYVIGDFDSVSSEEFELIKQACPRISACDPVDKDLTDTEMAFRWALDRKPSSILILGATGTRLDHTLANIHLLRQGLKEGVFCSIVDQSNEIMITDGYLKLERSPFQYVSLLPLSIQVTGVTLEGFEYPLIKARLEMGNTLSLSNRQRAETAHVSLQEGELLVIRSRD